MKDKRLEEIASVLFPAARHLVLTRPDHVRAADVGDLESLALRVLKREQVIIAPSIPMAIHKANEITTADGLICITGSLYLLGEVKKVLRAEY
jgi:dihydrofolate synthase/folylpolyglutamate synthase